MCKHRHCCASTLNAYETLIICNSVQSYVQYIVQHKELLIEFNDEEKDLSISQARSTLSQLCNDLAEHPHKGAIRITNNGEPKAVLIGHSLFEALIETLEIVSDLSLIHI